MQILAFLFRTVFTYKGWFCAFEMYAKTIAFAFAIHACWDREHLSQFVNLIKQNINYQSNALNIQIVNMLSDLSNIRASDIFMLICKGSELSLKIENPNYETSKIMAAAPNPQDIKQLWYIVEIDKNDHSYEIVNAFSNHVLTIENDFVVLRRGRQKPEQLFAITSPKRFQFIFKNKDASKALCLLGVLLYAEIDGEMREHHIFKMEKIEKNQHIAKTVLIKNRYTGKFIDLKQFSLEEGQEIIQYDLHGRFNQRWFLREQEPPATQSSILLKAGTRHYRILSLFSKQCITTKQMQHSSRVVQTKYQQNSFRQIWVFIPISEKDKIYQIVPYNTEELALGVYHNGKNSNQLALVHLYEESSEWQIVGQHNNSQFMK